MVDRNPGPLHHARGLDLVGRVVRDTSSRGGIVLKVLAVRHADIDLPAHGADPSLNQAGRARSESLARWLADAGVTAILVSSRSRTQQTAEPLATRLGLVPDVVDTPAGVAHQLRDGAFGAVVLVVGHSNTVPSLVDELGAGAVPAIGETEFDNLYVVSVGDASSDVLRLHYT
jgi:phosphohistidine phosphatase SixA